MTNVELLAEQGRRLLEQLVPNDAVLPLSMIIPAGAVVIGLIAAVLGARLARPAMTSAFAICGAAAGAAIGESMQVSVPVSATGGAVVCGVVGFVMHRLWVAVAAFALLAVAASGAIGYFRLLPQVQGYAQSPPEVLVQGQAGAVPIVGAMGPRFGDPGRLTVNAEFGNWLDGVWREARAKDRALPRDLILVSFTAGMLGFMAGLIAVRLTLVVATSVIGTALLMSGTGGLLVGLRPEWYEASMMRPQVVGLAWGVVLAGSFVLQGLLTRPDKSRAKKNAVS